MNAFVPLRDRAHGQWRHICRAIGIDEKHLTGKNAPCPMCGGTDRFKFFDTGRNGTWFCRKCSPTGGRGADLVMKFTGRSFRDVLPLIEQHLGKPIRPKPIQPAIDPRPKLRRMWAVSHPTVRGDVVDGYLRSRGVGLERYPPSIRTAASLRYYDDDATGTFPAMLALVRDITGNPVTIHRTYLAENGSGKAPVEKPRKIVSKHGNGPHVRLTPVATTLGIAEGIETALAASRLFGIPTWSVLSTYGVETFEPPVEVNHLIIFADHDINGAGQKAAYALAARLAGTITVEVKIPDKPGTDWNDVNPRNQQHGISS
jgi:putative DNA primase/helicase